MIRKVPQKKTPALVALERAAKKVQERARRNGTAAYVMENGKIINVAGTTNRKRNKRK